MNPRAACRLETLGYGEVYDYVGGKADWLAAGLASVGHDRHEPRAGDRLDATVLTCGVDEALSEVAGRLRAASADIAIVVNERHVVLGRLRLGHFPEEGSEPAAAAMEEGPTTVRASEPLEPLLGRMRARGTAQVIVTTPEGQLLGIVQRDE